MGCPRLELLLIFMAQALSLKQGASAFKTRGLRDKSLGGLEGDPITMLELHWGSPYSKVEGTGGGDLSVIFTLSDVVEGVVGQRSSDELLGENQCAAVGMKASEAKQSKLLTMAEVGSADDCQQLCRGALDCKAAVFDAGALTCELLKNVDGLSHSPGSTVVLPTCDHDCFEKGQAFTGSGTSIGFAPNANMCQALCASAGGCHGFTWNSTTLACLSFPQDNEVEEDSNAVSGPKANCHTRLPVVEYQGSCEIQGYSGSKFGNISQQPNVDSYEACRKLCLNNAMCKWLTFNSATRICFLKSGRGALERIKKGDSTGPRHCDGKCFQQDVELVGTPIRTVNNTLSAHFCHFECWNLLACGMWSFDEATRNCYLHEQSVSMRGRRSAHYWTGGRSACGVDALYNIPSKPCAVRGVQYKGEPLFLTSVGTAEACQVKCQVTSTCEAWAFDTLLGKCELFRAHAESRKQSSLDFISGPRWCQPSCMKVNTEGTGSTMQHFPTGFATPEESPIPSVAQLQSQAETSIAKVHMASAGLHVYSRDDNSLMNQGADMNTYF
ncbi:hypothetical protein Esti_006774 [Eimeria stiedai]